MTPSRIALLSTSRWRARARRVAPWLCSLVLLVQRAPTVRWLAEAQFSAPARAVEFLRWTVLAITGAGSYHALAGATQFIHAQNPDPGVTTEEMTIAFDLIGTPTRVSSYRIEGGVPPGLQLFQDAFTSQPEPGWSVNSSGVPVLRGIPRQPGLYTLTITGFKGRDNDSLGYAPVTATFDILVEGDPWAGPVDTLTASAGTWPDRIELTWSSAADAAAYEVWGAATGDFAEAVLLATVDGPPWAQEGLEPGQVRHYRVRGQSAAGPGEFSPVAEGRTSDPPPPYVFRAAEEVAGVKHLPGFGYFADTAFPWIFHLDHGFLYTVGTEPTDLWLFSLEFGWLWTGLGTHPFLYWLEAGGWLQTLAPEAGQRRYWSYATGELLTRPGW